MCVSSVGFGETALTGRLVRVFAFLLCDTSIHGLVTGIYWKYVVEAELSKLTYVEDKIIISPLFLCISMSFLQKAMVQYTLFKTVLLYLFKVYPSL